jgi:hypothetical protein
MSKEKILYKKRAFLNDDVSMSGFIIAVLEEFTHGRGAKASVSAWPEISIGDCSNKISLDFGFHNYQNMKKAAKKLKVFREAINGFADAFEAEVKRAEEIKLEKEKARKKNAGIKRKSNRTPKVPSK